MVKLSDCQVSDLGSIPGEVSLNIFRIYLLINLSNYMRILKKTANVHQFSIFINRNDTPHGI